MPENDPTVEDLGPVPLEGTDASHTTECSGQITPKLPSPAPVTNVHGEQFLSPDAVPSTKPSDHAITPSPRGFQAALQYETFILFLYMPYFAKASCNGNRKIYSISLKDLYIYIYLFPS